MMSTKRNQLNFFAADSDLADVLSESWRREELGLLEAGIVEYQPAYLSELVGIELRRPADWNRAGFYIKQPRLWS